MNNLADDDVPGWVSSLRLRTKVAVGVAYVRIPFLTKVIFKYSAFRHRDKRRLHVSIVRQVAVLIILAKS